MKRHFAFLPCLFLSTLTLAQIPAPDQSINCTVQGQIIQDPGGMPIRKVDIFLSAIGDEKSDEPAYTTITDAEGRFGIENVKPGKYRLYFGRNGFVDIEKRHHGSGMLVPLAPGQELKDLVLRLQVVAAITGKITDRDGDPMPDAEVMAIPHARRLRVPVFGWMASDRLSRSESNDLGEFRIGDLSPGRYFVVVHPPIREIEPLKARNRDESVYATTYYPGTIDKDRAVPVELHAGDELPVNLSLATTRAFHVRGTVKSFSAHEGAQSRVILRPKNANGLREKEFWLNKDGAFDISGVLPGSYMVFVVTSGQSVDVLRGSQTIEVNDSDIEDLHIATIGSSQVRGQFRMDNGKKIDWSGTMVGLESDEDDRKMQESSMSPPPSQLKSDGSFEIKDVTAGTYQIQVRSSNKTLQDYFVKTVNVGGKDISDSGVTVDGGAYSLDFIISANGSAIEGIVVADDKEPIAHVQVVCIPDTNRRNRRDLYQQALTDQKGNFSLRGLNPGEYQIFALDGDFDQDEITDPEFLRTRESLGRSVKLNEGERKNIVLKLVDSSEPQR